MSYFYETLVNYSPREGFLGPLGVGGTKLVRSLQSRIPCSKLAEAEAGAHFSDLKQQLKISHMVSYFYETLANHPPPEGFVCPLGVGGTK